MGTCNGNKIKLFCIPYAGGKADMFDELSGFFREEITVVPIEYAGHGTRITEAFYKSFQQMVEDVAQRIEFLLCGGEQFALFGYSMGSIAAYEIAAQKLLSAQPAQLFLAAHEAPGEPWESVKYSKMSDGDFAAELVKFGGFEYFEERFLKNRYFHKMIFDPVRADYRLIADYCFAHHEKLEIPVTMFYSPHDISKESILKWQMRFQTEVGFVEMGESHFFIREHAQEIAQIISRFL